ncbi:MAG: insulinase family protein, partial [Opitutae bacterium]
VYTIQINGALEKVPYEHSRFGIVIPCAPENVEKLVAATYAELARIRQQGLKPEELQKEIEAQRRNVEKDQQDNGAWVWKLDMIYRFEGANTRRLSHPNELIELVTASNLQRVALKYLDTAQAVRFTMLPEKPMAGGKSP